LTPILSDDALHTRDIEEAVIETVFKFRGAEGGYLSVFTGFAAKTVELKEPVKIIKATSIITKKFFFLKSFFFISSHLPLVFISKSFV